MGDRPRFLGGAARATGAGQNLPLQPARSEAIAPRFGAGPEPIGRALPRAMPALLLCGVLLLGAALRLQNLNWDQYQHVHPDERFIVWVADTVSWPGSLAAALDPATSPLNPFRWPANAGNLAGQPRNYAYGHLPLYLLVSVAHLAQSAGRALALAGLAVPDAWLDLATYNYLAPVGRAISAFSDVITLALVFVLAQRLYGERRAAAEPLNAGATGKGQDSAAPPQNFRGAEPRTLPWPGLLAAAAYACAVMPIQLSHFYAVDMVLTLCVTATVLAAVIAAQTGAGWAWVMGGVFMGLAVGSKFSAILLAVPLAVAALHGLPDAGHPEAARPALVRRLALVLLPALAVFAITNPFALIAARDYLRQLAAQNAMISGRMDAPYTRQFAGTIPYWYYIRQLSQWGLGWPLGIGAWAGLAWATIRVLRARAGAGEVVAVSWVLPYFAITGAFYAKFPRYLAPILPLLLVFAAGGAVALCRQMPARMAARPGETQPRSWRLLIPAAIAGVLLFSAGWAVTFSGVYRQEHPWLQASNWIYTHVAEGSKLLSEQWDDALPLAMDEIPARPPKLSYHQAQLPLYDPDTTAKLDRLADELSSADFIVLASNRLSAPIQRLPQRYPLASQYYQLLFGGELGYTEVADFTAYPQLAGIRIPDDNADESFTVYDHPHPRIFANTGRFSAERLRSRLARNLPLNLPAAQKSDGGPEITGWPTAPRSGPLAQTATGEGAGSAVARSAKALGEGVRGTISGGKAPGMAMIREPAQGQASSPELEPPEPELVMPAEAVSDLRWNRLASAWPPLAVALWWLVTGLFGWLAWPLLFPLLGGLRDRGYGIARLAGWLLVGWVHWLGASLRLWSNTGPAIAIVLAALAAAGVVAAARQRQQMVEYWKRARRLLLIEEAIFAAAFLIFVGIRLLDPDLWQPWNGGEKFMEFAFLNAILRSAHFPPYDPYFAGGTINYYYYGLYLVSLPIKLTGIFPEVAFNLAVPGLFALAAQAAFALGASLAARTRVLLSGLLAVVLALLLANLVGLIELANTFVRAAGAAQGELGPVGAGLAALLSGRAAWPGYDYWAVSRVIPATINEFPYWSFLFADLHPHLIAMPVGLGVMGLALSWLLTSHQPATLAMSAGRLALLIIMLGALGPTNTWDLPVYFALVAAVLLVSGWRRRRARLLPWRALGQAVLVGAGAVLVYLPFYLHYQNKIGGQSGPLLARYLGLVHEGSPLRPWLDLWAFFLFLAYSFVLLELLGRKPVRSRRVVALLGAAGLALVLFMLGRPTAAIAALPCVLALGLGLRRTAPPRTAFVCLLLALALGILSGVELVYLRDFLEGGDWYRMNTVFKFGMPAWLLLGAAGAVILPYLWDALRRRNAALAAAWSAAVLALLAAGLVFLPFGTQARVSDRFPGDRPALGTLDGMAYMTAGRYSWPDDSHTIELAGDYQAIHWLLDHVRGAPVVAEAPAGSYSLAGGPVGYDYYRAGGLRVASLTGLPTFVGQHQYEQRDGDQVSARSGLGQEFFETTSLDRTRTLMRDLAVEYIYVGQLERLLFPPASLAKFDSLVQSGELRPAYDNAGVKIYQVAR